MNNNARNILILLIISVVFFILGNDVLSLTNPDEVFYAQTAKEMIQHRTWIVPYLFGQPQFEKPVLTYWLLRVGFILFDISSFGARFFPALFALLGVIAVYIICHYAYGQEKKAFICALIMSSSGLYIGLARSVFTDMIFSVFILLALAIFFIGYVDRNSKGPGIIFFFIFSAFAVLTKGPLGILVPLSVIILFLAINKELNFLFSKYTVFGFLSFLAISIPWYVFMINKFGSSFIREFFYNVHIRRILEAEHRSNDTWFFYPISMIACMAPWSIYTIGSFFYLIKKLKERNQSALYLFLSCWILATFVMFQGAHSKLVSYIFPMFPALAIITGDYIYNMISSRRRIFYILSYISCFLLIILLIAIIVASKIYSNYFPSAAGLGFFICFYLSMLAAALLFIKRRLLFQYVYLFSCIIPLFLFFVLSWHTAFDDFVSSKNASEYLLNNYKVDNAIICSKFFVRGVRFYTDKDIAAVDINGRGYFSPHPIPYLDSDEKVRDFLRDESVSFGILKKSALEDVQRMAATYGFNVDLLKIIGDEYVVKIQPR